MGNSSTISTNTTIPEGFNVALFTSPSNPSITINSGISYTVSSNADVSIISLSNFF